MTGGASLSVVEPGLQTTVQDLGRPGLMRFGVAPGGALDRRALVLGNRLVGNEPGAAALEMTLVGARLRCSGSVVAVLTGADLGATVNGAALPLWEPFRLDDGDEIVCRLGMEGGTGARAYLCAAGGLAIEPVMGSRATDLFGGFGGWHGRPLRAGDVLPIAAHGTASEDLLKRRLSTPPPADDVDAPIRVVLGPQADRFTDAGIAAFLGGRYVVAPRSDRMGLRLEGPAVAHADGADQISEGIGHGAVQVPGDGRPIVLLAARQTIGGYPKIATAIGADLDRLGQLRPGDPVRFGAVDIETARSLTLAARATLGDDAVTTAPRPGSNAAPTKTANGTPTESGNGPIAGGDWGPESVAQLARALRDADVSSFRIEIAGLGLRLELTWANVAAGETAGGENPSAPPAAGERADADDGLVTAPVLGVFYRRGAPDQPPLVEEGELVEAGRALGLLEVMKTYHEVTAPRAGRVGAFLVEDGAFVEYGSPIVRLAPTKDEPAAS